MSFFRNYLNIRTFAILILSQFSCFIAITYHYKLQLDFVLFGLAIVFPIATSIQTAFKRRERALEYLSLLKAGSLAIHYSFSNAKKLSANQKRQVKNILTTITDKVLHQLQASNGDMVKIQTEFDKIFEFIEQNREVISGRIVIRVVRYMKDVADSTAFLLSLVRHRTMAGLRFYAILFITFFSGLHGPVLLYRLDEILPVWMIYFSAAFSSLLLITLYNFQQLIEYPFDQKGPDDIKLSDFKLNI